MTNEQILTKAIEKARNNGWMKVVILNLNIIKYAN